MSEGLSGAAGKGLGREWPRATGTQTGGDRVGDVSEGPATPQRLPQGRT